MSIRETEPGLAAHSRARLAALLAALMVVGLLAAPPAVADPGDPLGPTLIETDEGPSGYAVQFRYDAPEGVESVHVWGDWWFSRPEAVTGNNVSDRINPADWRPGLIAATPWLTIPLTEGPDGIWEVTVPLPAGSYRYVFTHDCDNELGNGCDTFPDPENMWELDRPYPNAPGLIRSTVFVPEHPDFPTYPNDYQRPPDNLGTLTAVRYPSPLSNNPPEGVHDMVVYLPHGYDPDREIPYPTLYLSHGGGDHSTAWTMQGRAHYILENAIADGEAEPMVIISTDFNGLPGGSTGYVNELVNNVFPYVEENYNVSTRAEDRAFAGFSAGGFRAFTILYDYTHLFGYHGPWSAGVPQSSAEQNARMMDVRGGIHIGTGRQDPLGNIGANTVAGAQRLIDLGVPVTAFHVEGVHTWHSWRPLLNFYIREMIFQQTPEDRLEWLSEDGDITEGMESRIAHALEMYEAWIQNPRQRGPALSHLDRAIHLLLWQADVVEKGKPNQGDPDGLRMLAWSIQQLRDSHDD